MLVFAMKSCNDTHNFQLFLSLNTEEINKEHDKGMCLFKGWKKIVAIVLYMCISSYNTGWISAVGNIIYVNKIFWCSASENQQHVADSNGKFSNCTTERTLFCSSLFGWKNRLARIVEAATPWSRWRMVNHGYLWWYWSTNHLLLLYCTSKT